MCVTLDYAKTRWNECVRCGRDATQGERWSSVGARICAFCLTLPPAVFSRLAKDHARREALLYTAYRKRARD